MAMASRALHGVNLSGWLTLRMWVTPSLYVDSGALDEGELVRSIGKDEYRERIDRHRASFITQSDFVQIASRGFNCVRLPVPWYVFGEAGPNPGPYIGCIELVDEAFDWADEIGLKIILDLDIKPGAEDATDSIVRGHDDFSHYKDDMVSVIAALAKRYGTRAAFRGLEVADAPKLQLRRGLSVEPGVPLHRLRNYYREAYDAVRQEAGEDPAVVIHDGGRVNAWDGFMAPRRYRNVWIDSALFHYSDNIKSAGPAAIRELSRRSRESIKSLARSGLPVMVGSWSGAMPFSDTISTPEGRIALERIYISEQISSFSSCAGWFFQTWKTSGRLDGWDARVSLASFERRMLA